MQRCLGVIIHNIEGQFPYGGCLNTLILLTPKAGLGRPDVEMRVVGGGGAHAAAHPFQQRLQGYACIFSFPMCVWEQALPSQLEAREEISAEGPTETTANKGLAFPQY